MKPETYVVSSHPQGTPEWLAERVGYITGSRAADICAVRKDGKPAAAREDYLTQVVVERLTNTSAEDTHVTPWMERGSALEQEARSALETYLDTLIFEVGFISSLTLPQVGCSVDGYTNDGHIIELKVPKPKTHLRYLQNRSLLEDEYRAQCDHNLLVTGADKCWLVSFCPVMPIGLRLVVLAIYNDQATQFYKDQKLVPFMREVDAAVNYWREYMPQEVDDVSII